MTLLIEELKEQLKKLDELTLLERLNLTSEEIVELAEDNIIDMYDSLIEEFEDDDAEE